METTMITFQSRSTRLGFHYYPDTLHYGETDLQTWLPRLKELGASWLVLPAILNRAVPEHFITGLLQAGIEPVLHFRLPLVGAAGEQAEFTPLLQAYARWGVRGVLFFDQPNARSAWPASSWTQTDLVERFLDRFLPLAETSLGLGLLPIFPALEPGGSYWDTAFLRTALEALERRKQNLLLDNLVLAANAWTFRRSLNWGAGGPERWPDARPYFTPQDEQDQLGFRIADWYQAVSMAVLQRNCPMILLNAGVASNPLALQRDVYDTDEHAAVNLSIARLLAGEQVQDSLAAEKMLEPVSSSVIACCCWLLAAGSNSPFAAQGWYEPESGAARPAAKALLAWRKGGEKESKALPSIRAELDGLLPAVQECVVASGVAEKAEGTLEPAPGAVPPDAAAENTPPTQAAPAAEATPEEPVPVVHPLRHYLLLPTYEWGVADWHLQVIQPFVKRHLPVVGFSLEEAALAAQVTVVGNAQTFPEEALERLRQGGCVVERISGTGTDIATLLAER